MSGQSQHLMHGLSQTTSGGTTNGRFASLNPFEQLAVMVSDNRSRGSTQSPSSAGASDSSKDTVIAGSSQGVNGYSNNSPAKDCTDVFKIAAFSSSQATRGPGSRFGQASARQFSTQVNRRGQSTPASRTQVGGPPSARRYSAPIAPMMLPPAFAANSRGHQTLYAIPEELAVQEFAFRRGQQDRGNARARHPMNPFPHEYNEAWNHFYKVGKQSTSEAVKIPAGPPSPSRENYDWPILINPFTQDPEHPKGSYDEQWAREACEAALNGMANLVSLVCKRGKDWDRVVCDTPAPILTALYDFPDLMERYERLQCDAQEALGGGLPRGY